MREATPVRNLPCRDSASGRRTKESEAALIAILCRRATERAPECGTVQVKAVPEVRGHDLLKFFVTEIWPVRISPTKPLRYSMHVSVYGQHGEIKRIQHYAFCDRSRYTGQGQQNFSALSCGQDLRLINP